MISGQGIHTLSLGKARTHDIRARQTHTKSRQSTHMISGQGIHTLSLGKVYTMISGQGIHTLSLGKVYTDDIWARHTHTKSRQSIHT